jgi:hypothetical protein
MFPALMPQRFSISARASFVRARRDEQQIDAHERYSLSSVVKHRGPNFTGIMERAVITPCRTRPGLPSRGPGNIAFGESGFEHAFGNSGGRTAWRIGCA